MIYLDTSFLTPLFREESSSGKVSKFLSQQEPGVLTISQWVGVEFASLTSRDVRVGALTADQGRQMIEEFDALVAASLNTVTPGANDFALAKEYVSHFSTHLRGPDALHLAVAHNHGAEFVATLDEGMLAAAKKVKMPARRVIR
jgi:predicted nucleic acid-binding protein